MFPARPVYTAKQSLVGSALRPVSLVRTVVMEFCKRSMAKSVTMETTTMETSARPFVKSNQLVLVEVAPREAAARLGVVMRIWATLF